MTVPELTLTEERIVRLLVAGETKGEVAERLGLDERSVDWHVRRAARKLEGASSLESLLRAAMEGRA